MGDFIAYLGLFVFLGGLVGMVFPRLDRLTWPDLHYSTAKGALILSPSPPRIAPSQLRLVE